jgi:hypothetical protein
MTVLLANLQHFSLRGTEVNVFNVISFSADKLQFTTLPIKSIILSLHKSCRQKVTGIWFSIPVSYFRGRDSSLGQELSYSE